jgi:hypothetical protein
MCQNDGDGRLNRQSGLQITDTGALCHGDLGTTLRRAVRLNGNSRTSTWQLGFVWTVAFGTATVASHSYPKDFY